MKLKNLALARPVPNVDVEELGAHNLPEAFLSESDRDDELGPHGDSILFIPTTEVEAEEAGFNLGNYAVGYALGSPECDTLCAMLAPYWAANLVEDGSIRIVIARQAIGLRFEDDMPQLHWAEADELFDYARSTLIALLAPEVRQYLAFREGLEQAIGAE